MFSAPILKLTSWPPQLVQSFTATVKFAVQFLPFVLRVFTAPIQVYASDL